jgi:hypothetical protein
MDGAALAYAYFEVTVPDDFRGGHVDDRLGGQLGRCDLPVERQDPADRHRIGVGLLAEFGITPA